MCVDRPAGTVLYRLSEPISVASKSYTKNYSCARTVKNGTNDKLFTGIIFMVIDVDNSVAWLLTALLAGV